MTVSVLEVNLYCEVRKWIHWASLKEHYVRGLEIYELENKYVDTACWGGWVEGGGKWAVGLGGSSVAVLGSWYRMVLLACIIDCCCCRCSPFIVVVSA